MGFLNNLMGKAQSLLSKPRPEGRETIAVRHTRFDREDFREVMSASDAMRDVVERMGQSYDYTEDLAEGIFDYFLKAEPEVVTAPEMAQSRMLNHQVTMTGKESAEVTELRQYTKADPYSAAMAVVGVSEKLEEYLAEQTELAEKAREAAEAEKERREAEQAAQEAMTTAQSVAGDYDGEGPPTQEQAAAADALAEALAALEAAQDGEDAAGQALAEEMAAATPGTRQATKAGIKEATEDARSEAQAMTAAGVDPGEAKHLPFDARKTLAEALAQCENLRKYAKWIGRMRLEASAERARRIEHVRDVFVDVEPGDDLSRVLGGELAKMRGPRPLRLDTLRRYAGKQLLVRKFEGTERAGRGTILAIVDTSGSMRCNISGKWPDEFDSGLEPSREAWAKGFTFVLLDSARSQNRDFYAILFSSNGQQRHYDFPAKGKARILEADGKTEIPVDPIPGSDDLAVVLDLITFFYDGGTDFEEPLSQGLDVIETNFDVNGRPRADVCFITDDDGHVSPAFMTEYQRVKDKVGIRTFGIAVGCGAGNTLTAVSDSVRSIADLTATDEVTDIFRTV